MREYIRARLLEKKRGNISEEEPLEIVLHIGFSNQGNANKNQGILLETLSLPKHKSLAGSGGDCELFRGSQFLKKL